MPTPVVNCGGECGVLGTSTFGTGHFYAAAGTPTFSTSTVRSGARSLRINPGGVTTAAGLPIAASAQLRIIVRFYVYYATLPNADAQICRAGSGPQIRYDFASGKVFAAVGTTLGATGVVIAANQWYRIDADFNISAAGNDTCDVQVDGVALGQATAAGLAAGVTEIQFGVSSTVTVDFFIDDVVVSLTAADYPLGPGKILAFSPNADGTHTATGTNLVRGTIAAPTGSGNVAGSTDTNAYVNAKPLGGGVADNTRLVNHQTNASTEYAEVAFEPTTEQAAPRAVDVITADRQAATTNGNFQTKLNDNGTEDAIANRGTVAGSTSDRYVNKQYATMVGGGAWTLERFNNLKARFGYSSDATPDQYWRGIMIEADFADDTPEVRGRPYGLLGQQQMHQLLAQ